MADLKIGTQIGGNLVWHQGILDLNPVDTKLYYRDQEVLLDTGYQTLKGTMMFNVPATQYDIESVSILPTGSKSMMRKFRGGANDTIWHETVQGGTYKIATGTTDATLVMQLVSGGAATFQTAVLTNAAQSPAVNSFTRKDFVTTEDAKKVNKAGDGMTGNLDFNLDNQGIRVKFPGGSVANNTGIFGGQGDAASRTKTNMQIKSWWGVGFSPSGTGTAVAPGENSIWFDTRTGNMYTVGRAFVGSDQEVYSPLNKPTPSDIDAYTKAEVDDKTWLRVKDERTAMIAPNALQSKTVAAYFTNQSDVTTSWVSGFTVNGWENTYAAWSIFASARSDTDDKRLWFKHGRTDWAPSTRIYHEDDKPTNVELNVVSRAGDAMSGALNMQVPDALGFSKYSIKLNNGSIGGINQLVFGDPSDTFSEGIMFPKSGKNDQSTLAADYDALWAFDGVLKFNGKAAYGEWNKPTSSDTNSLYVELTSTAVDLNTLGSITDANNSSSGLYRQESNANATVAKNYPVAIAGTLLVTPSAYGCQQEYTTFTGRKFQRGLVGAFTGAGPWGPWTEFYSEVSPKQFVNKVGDTMTGVLIATQFKSSTDYGFVRSTNNAHGMFLGADGRTIIGSGVGSVIVRPTGIGAATAETVFNTDGTVTIAKTGTADSHLVTKKYVDDKVGTAVQSVTATGAVKSTGGINPVISLANATNAADGAMSAADKAKLDGIPAAAVNRTGDTMTGILNAPAFVQTAAQSTAAAASTRKDYVDAQIKAVDAQIKAVDVKNVAKAGDTMTGDLINTKSIRAPVILSEANGRNIALEISAIVGDNRPYVSVDFAYRALEFNDNKTVTAPFGFEINGRNSNSDYFIRTGGYVGNWARGLRLVEGPTDLGVKAGIGFYGVGDDTSLIYLGFGAAPWSVNGIQINTTNQMTLKPGQVSALNLLNRSSIKFADGASTHFHLFSQDNYFRISTGTAGQTNMMSIDSAGNMDVAGSTVSKYFRTDELGGTDTVAPYRSASQGGAFASMYNRHASFHTDVVQAGSSYAPNTSIKYQHNNNYAGMFSTGVLSVSAVAQPGTYSIAHVDSSGNRVYTWSFSGGDGKFSSAIVDATTVEVSGLITAGKLRTTGDLTVNNSNPTVLFQDTDNKSAFAHVNSNNFYILRSAGNNGTTFDSGPNGIHPMTLNLDNGDANFSRNGSFNDVQIRSDIRLKSNLLPIGSALDKVYTLFGFTFDKVGCEFREAGIIAQDLQKVLPEAVGSFKTTAGDEFLTISNSGVSALLVEAIKELTDRVKYLESKLN